MVPASVHALGIVLLLLVSACSQHATVRTLPPGATFYLNGERQGETPTLISVRPGQTSQELRYRIERAGYEPQEGELSKRIHGGRIAAAILTAGTTLFFRWPVAIRPRYDFVLLPLPTVDRPLPAPTDDVP